MIRLSMGRAVVVAFLGLVGCGNMSQPVDAGADMTPAADLARSGAPAGFGAACTSSTDCREFSVDGGPGFLGCASYLGANYCTLPCAPSVAGVAACWAGTSCKCVEHTNAGGFAETDCFCAK
jgi:uncharacterized lipoprotein NlpE involved in copper resistance